MAVPTIAVLRKRNAARAVRHCSLLGIHITIICSGVLVVLEYSHDRVSPPFLHISKRVYYLSKTGKPCEAVAFYIRGIGFIYQSKREKPVRLWLSIQEVRVYIFKTGKPAGVLHYNTIVIGFISSPKGSIAIPILV